MSIKSILFYTPLYIVKLGFTGVYLFFLSLLQNIGCGCSLEPPLVTIINVLTKIIENIIFPLKIFKAENISTLHGQIFSLVHSFYGRKIISSVLPQSTVIAVVDMSGRCLHFIELLPNIRKDVMTTKMNLKINIQVNNYGLYSFFWLYCSNIL